MYVFVEDEAAMEKTLCKIDAITTKDLALGSVPHYYVRNRFDMGMTVLENDDRIATSYTASRIVKCDDTL